MLFIYKVLNYSETKTIGIVLICILVNKIIFFTLNLNVTPPCCVVSGTIYMLVKWLRRSTVCCEFDYFQTYVLQWKFWYPKFDKPSVSRPDWVKSSKPRDIYVSVQHIMGVTCHHKCGNNTIYCPIEYLSARANERLICELIGAEWRAVLNYVTVVEMMFCRLFGAKPVSPN